MADSTVTFTAADQRWSTLTNAAGGTNGVKALRPSWAVAGQDDEAMLSVSLSGTWGATICTLQRRPIGETTWRDVAAFSVADVPLEDDIGGLSPDWEYDIVCTSFAAASTPKVDLR